MNRLSPDRGKALRVSDAEVIGNGLQRGHVLVDRSETGTHRVHRHVGGAGRGPRSEFVGGLPKVTAPTRILCPNALRPSPNSSGRGLGGCRQRV